MMKLPQNLNQPVRLQWFSKNNQLVQCRRPVDLVVATINNSAQTSSSGVEVVRRRRDEWKKDRFGSSRVADDA
jgi:hypothetical protein